MHGAAAPARRGALRRGGGLLAFVLLVGGLIAGSGIPARAEGTPPPEAFILVDARTGSVITGRNMHEALPAASTVKIMTALVATERLSADSRIPVSANAAGREAMRIGMQPGASWPFDQVMASMMMVSANDAAYALAEKAGGSISGFAADANETARRYGMRDSTFGDPAGLDDATSYDGGPRVSAYDLAIAARNALTVPVIASWAGTTTYQFTDPSGVQHSLTNHDKFLEGNGFGYIGANGFKTGWTNRAQHSLVATARRNGRECIAVILGGVDSGYTWAASLLDKCWQHPRVETTGKFLPPVAVSPYGARVAARAGFARISGAAAVARSKPIASTPTAAATTAPAPTTPGTAAATRPAGGNTRTAASPAADPARETRTATPAAAVTRGGSSSGGGGAGLLGSMWTAILILVVLAGGFVLRRRAVKRQRVQRIARQRARAKAMRAGSLPVVDGRYRTGMRVGPPVDSRVRVARSHIDLPTEERVQARSRSGNGRRSSDF